MVPSLPLGDSEPSFIPNTDYDIWSRSRDAPRRPPTQTAPLRPQSRASLTLALGRRNPMVQQAPPTRRQRSPEKERALLYLGKLSSPRYRVWSRTNAYDWMIADSQKRIAQLRSSQENNGTTTCRVVSAGQGTQDYSLALFKSSQQQVEWALEQTRIGDREFEIKVARTYDERANGSQMVYSQQKNKMVTHTELVTDTREALKTSREELEQYYEVVRKLVADARKRSKGWWDIRSG